MNLEKRVEQLDNRVRDLRDDAAEIRNTQRAHSQAFDALKNTVKDDADRIIKAVCIVGVVVVAAVVIF